jgi:hypothetical protein
MAVNLAEHALILEAANETKHDFVHIFCDPRYISSRTTISVNRLLQISYGNTDWHGSAIYTSDELAGQWAMTFNYAGDTEKMKTTVFKQILGTSSFMHINSNKAYNSILIPKDKDW